jgi:Fic family protein
LAICIIGRPLEEVRYNWVKPSDFAPNRAGNLVQGERGYWAFVPNPLEPDLVLDIQVVKALSEADRFMSELAGGARTLPNPHLLIGPFMRREAVLSSRIEGTQASLSDLFFFEAAQPEEPEAPDVREVANYVRALEYGLERLNDLPLSLRLIREMHERLMRGVRGEEQTPGEFRTSQNWIGPPGCTLMNATYVPPPVDEMKSALDKFEKYLHAPSELPPLIRLALVHYHFEAIHPFLDGNGRIGRLIITLLLCTEKLLPQPLLYLSAFFEKHREEYYALLMNVSRRGDWLAWIHFFLRAVAVQAKDAIARSDALLSIWSRYRSQLQEARASALLLRLVDGLFSFPAITASFATRLLDVTPRSAQLNINKLVDAGILEEATGQKRNRVYVAREIISIVEKSDL